MSYDSIAIAYGDGIGPEIMEATMSIIAASKAVFKIEPIELGKEVYEKGWEFGIADSSWQVIERNKILLKAPLTTPQGKGYKSLNVKLRKVLGLYLNIRPVKSFIKNDDNSRDDIDMVIIRENDEDLYSGIEYQNTVDSAECAKIITYGSSSRAIRYAFDFAKHNKRKQVSCMVKDNIMKMTDGIFHKEFNRIKGEYKNIETKSYIIDIGSALIAKYPQMFDVVVTSNLYGDIISDIAAEVSGSVGMAGGINLGKNYTMFEAVHGSAPDIAGLGIANPSGLLQGAINMLNYIGFEKQSKIIFDAWYQVIQSGIHTSDIYKEGKSKAKVNCNEFTQEIIKKIEEKVTNRENYNISLIPLKKTNDPSPKDKKRILIGVDLFIDRKNNTISSILNALKSEYKNDVYAEIIYNGSVIDGLGDEKFNSNEFKIRKVVRNDKDCGRYLCIRLIIAKDKNEKIYNKIDNDTIFLYQKFLEKLIIDIIKINYLYQWEDESLSFALMY